jgi:hypothetical protein
MHKLQHDIFLFQSLHMSLQTEECLKTISYHPFGKMVAYALRRKLWLVAPKLMQHCLHNLLHIHASWLEKIISE